MENLNEKLRDPSGKYVYWRFLSKQELKSYLNGKTIQRLGTDKGKTTAPKESMFFLSPEVKVKASLNGAEKTISPKEAYSFLQGIVSNELLVEFSTNTQLQKSIGIYHDSINDDAWFFDEAEVEEWYIPSYNNTTMFLEHVYIIDGGIKPQFLLVDDGSLMGILDEAIASEPDNYNAIIKELEAYYKPSDFPMTDAGPCYILKNGKFVYLDKQEENTYFPMHGDEKKYLILKKGFTKHDVNLALDIYLDGALENNDGGFVPEDTIIRLTQKAPTEAQYKALQLWLDNILMNPGRRKAIDVAVNTYNEQRFSSPSFSTTLSYKTYPIEEPVSYPTGDYDIEPLIAETVIKNIKRYYTTGELVEGLEETTDSKGNSLSKEQVDFFSHSKVRDSENRLLVVYHGTSVKFDDFARPINWFTEDKNYAKQYATWLGGDETYYTVYLNCSHILDCGNTSAKCYALLPITRPFALSNALKNILAKADITEEEIRPVLEEAETYRKEGEEYTTPLQDLTRTKQFAALVKSKGFGAIKTIENRVAVCYGVFEPKNIKLITNKTPSSSNKMNEEDVEIEIDTNDIFYRFEIEKFSSFFQSINKIIGEYKDEDGYLKDEYIDTETEDAINDLDRAFYEIEIELPVPDVDLVDDKINKNIYRSAFTQFGYDKFKEFIDEIKYDLEILGYKLKKYKVQPRKIVYKDDYQIVYTQADLAQVEKYINEESIRNGYDKLVYRVDLFSGDRSTFKDKSVFFADSLEYFDYSDTGYSKEEAKEYYLNLKDFKVFDPMIQWKNDIDAETWSIIRTSEEFANKNDLYITDYLDGVDYEDPNVYHEVLIDTDSLAEYGRQNGYDVTILRDIASDGGRGPLFTEYAVHNSNAVKIKDAKVFNKENSNINEEENNYVGINSITEKEVLDAVEKLSDKDNISYVDNESIEFDSPTILITTGGDLLNATDYDTHSQFMYAVFKQISNLADFDAGYEEAYDYVVEKLGFITLNTGDGYSDDRCKIVTNLRLTAEQIQVILAWLDEQPTKDNNILEVYAKHQHCSYSLIETDSKDIVKKIQKRFISGVLEENLLENPSSKLYKTTQEQEDFFRNSKVRDAQGNLLVCYHGTPNPGFEEFNPKETNSQFGKYKFNKYNINYFTSSIQDAISYTEIGVEDKEKRNVYAVYLNITNPFVVNNKSLADIKSFQNIKDNNIREKQIDTFKKFWSKWKYKAEEDDLIKINKDLFSFNMQIEPNEENPSVYDLVQLEKNTMFGQKHPVLYAYTLDELFDAGMYEQVRDALVGDIETDPDDYYYTIDDLVKWVLLMNKEDNKNYDGIIVPDIYDIGPRGSYWDTPQATIYVTLVSSNQIKAIDNKTPTSSNNINEANSDFSTTTTFNPNYELQLASNVINKNYKHENEPKDGALYIDKEGKFIAMAETHKQFWDEVNQALHPEESNTDDAQRLMDAAENNGMIRVNDGNTIWEDEPYAVITKAPNPKQYSALKRWFDHIPMGTTIHLFTYPDTDPKVDDFMLDIDNPEQAIKSIRRYFVSGFLEEMNKENDTNQVFIETKTNKTRDNRYIIAYHGSQTNDIKKFESRNGYGKKGVFFSNSRELAKAFTLNTINGIYKCALAPNTKITLDAHNTPFNDLDIDNTEHIHISELLDLYCNKCDCLQIDNILEHGNLLVTDYIVFNPDIITILEQESLDKSKPLVFGSLNYAKKTENINLEEAKTTNEVLNYLSSKSMFDASYDIPKGATYLLPDGKFLDLNNIPARKLPSYAESGIVNPVWRFNIHIITDYAIADKFGSEYAVNNTLGRFYNCIKLNDGFYQPWTRYVELPEKPLTEAQYESLAGWLDIQNKEIEVIASNGDYAKKYYDFSNINTVSDNVIKDIKRQYNKQLSEEYLDEDNGIYTTTSVYDAVNRIKTSPSSLRILWDRKLNRYFICDMDNYIHRDMADKAVELGYYGQMQKWELDNYLDEYGKHVIYYIYAPKGKETETYGSDVSEDGYEGKYVYDFGTITTRSDDRYKASPLAKALGKYNEHYIQDGWIDYSTPKIIQVEQVLSKNKDIIKEVSQHFGTTDEPELTAMYILPNGSFLYTTSLEDEDDYPADEHRNIEDWLYKTGLSDRNTYFSDDGSLTLESLGAIRFNLHDGLYNFVVLNDQVPTDAQYGSLLKTLDLALSKNKSIDIIDTKGLYKRYYIKDSTADEVLKKIKTYYATGKLVETVNTNNIENILYKFPNTQAKDKTTVTLYHQTTLDKLKQILKDGYIKGDVWCQESIDVWQYGDYAICFEYPKDKIHKANNTDRVIYNAVPESCFSSIVVKSGRTEKGKISLLKELDLDESNLKHKPNNIDKQDVHYWYNPKDDTWNPTILVDGKKARLRVGVIIIKDGDKILLGEEEQEPGVFSLPGGAIDKGETVEQAGIRETQEEVHLNLENVNYTGIDYCVKHDDAMPWVKEHIPEEEWWVHYYTCLVIGKAKGEYKGDVEAKEEDPTMFNTSKFYLIKDVIDKPSFKKEWKEALVKFGYTV